VRRGRRVNTEEDAMKIRRILVGTDFSQNAQAAIGYAHSVAEQLGAELLVVHVEEASPLRTAIREGLMTESSTDAVIAEAVMQLTESRLAAALAGLPPNDVPIREIVRRGDPDAEIVECIRQYEADLLVVGMAGRSARETLRAALVGSVARSLLHKSPCPVLVVRLDHERTPPLR
jgi:nucleotide-binding universal stress UspA family protein